MSFKQSRNAKRHHRFAMAIQLRCNDYSPRDGNNPAIAQGQSLKNLDRARCGERGLDLESLGDARPFKRLLADGGGVAGLAYFVLAAWYPHGILPVKIVQHHFLFCYYATSVRQRVIGEHKHAIALWCRTAER